MSKKLKEKQQENIKINILGTDYKLIEEMPKNIPYNADGHISYTNKIINLDKDILKNNSLRYKKCVLRHEIIHGYFNESGLPKYSNDDELVEFLAMQLPKMIETFKKSRCEK